jgi:hypothetical protein
MGSQVMMMALLVMVMLLVAAVAVVKKMTSAPGRSIIARVTLLASSDCIRAGDAADGVAGLKAAGFASAYAHTHTPTHSYISHQTFPRLFSSHPSAVTTLLSA